MLFLKYCCVNVTGTGCFKKMIALLSNIEIRKRNVHGSIKKQCTGTDSIPVYVLRGIFQPTCEFVSRLSTPPPPYPPKSNHTFFPW